MRVGLSTRAIFGDLGGYVFENFRHKASNIIWRYAAPYKINDPEMAFSGYFMSNSDLGIVPALQTQGFRF